MRQITLIMLLVFGFSNAQFFQNDSFTDETNTGFFSHTRESIPFNQISRGVDDEFDFPTTPGEEPVPINEWQIILVGAAIALGYYCTHFKKSQQPSK